MKKSSSEQVVMTPHGAADFIINYVFVRVFYLFETKISIGEVSKNWPL